MLKYDAIIFDLDGTLYCGPKPIPGSHDVLRRLRAEAQCRFLSNNGEQTSPAIARRLVDMGMEVHESDVTTSADLVVETVTKEFPRCRFFPLASPVLESALIDIGCTSTDREADLVISGVSTTFTYDDLASALRLLETGARLIVTNEDPVFPTDRGFLPAGGALAGALRGMGFAPHRFCGKPDVDAVRRALSSWGLDDPSRCLFVGDNLGTDILSAHRVGADSALVLTGVASPNDVSNCPTHPTYVLPSVADLPSVLSR
jgi:4-nitrophenyl phosphatase